MLLRNKMFESITSYIIIILGWVVVHLLSAKRDRDKEWREFSRNTIYLIDKIVDEAIKYHTAECRELYLESKIKIDLDELDMRITLILQYLKVSCSIKGFRQSITLNNFDSKNFTKQQHTSRLVQCIYVQANRLRENLYSC